MMHIQIWKMEINKMKILEFTIIQMDQLFPRYC